MDRSAAAIRVVVMAATRAAVTVAIRVAVIHSEAAMLAVVAGMAGLTAGIAEDRR